MPTFNRLNIKPSADFIYNLSVKSLAAWIPVGYRWFDWNGLDADKELGKLVRAWAKPAAALRTAIETQRWEVFIQAADADYLDGLGSLIELNRKFGESDDDYAARIAVELSTGRISKNALERLVLSLSENQVAGNVFSPSAKVALWDNSWWNKYWPSPSYWRGSTFELQTNGVAPEDLEFVVKRSKAAGVKDWYAHIISANLNQANSFDLTFEASALNTTIESVGCTSDVSLVASVLPTELSLVGPDMGNILSWGMGLTFENIPTNYALTTDMLLSAQMGVAQHSVKITTPFDVNAVTDLQAAPIIW